VEAAPNTLIVDFVRFRVSLQIYGALPVYGTLSPASGGPGVVQHPAENRPQPRTRSDGAVAALFLQSGPGDRTRVLLGELVPDVSDGRTSFAWDPDRVLQAMASCEHAGEAMAALGEDARRDGLRLQATLTELYNENPEDIAVEDKQLQRIMQQRFQVDSAEVGANLLYMNVCTGGLPPILQLGGQGLLFPLRSWIPGGVTEGWRPLCQNLECEIGDRVIQHTDFAEDFNGSGLVLEDFHRRLEKDPGTLEEFAEKAEFAVFHVFNAEDA